MKICYIFTSAGLKSDSVQRKVIAQIAGLNAKGVKCRGAFFTTEVNERTKYSEHIEFIPYPISNRKYFNIIWQKRQLIKTVISYVERMRDSGEFIYLRYPGVTYRLYQLAKRNKAWIISEHQAMEIDEIRSAKNEHPLGLSMNKLISYFLYQWWPIVNEKIWGRVYSKNLRAKVTVTDEIANFHRKFCKTVWVIPNGIETDNYEVRSIPEWSNEVRLLFLKGTSGIASWNGFDRLIKSIDAFKLSSDIKIQLIICGSIIDGEVPDRNYIINKGYVDGSELDKLFLNCHIGFSTLCLFRKNLKEAAVLKAREYFARGLPFVYAYNDPDLEGESEVAEYTLQVPNDDSLIDFNKVVEFAKRVSEDPSHPEKMRKFAEEKLDWKIKMGQLKQMLSN